MSPAVVDLTDAELQRLEKTWPRTMGHGAIAARAMEIARIYLRRQYPECVFEAAERGADLNFRSSPDAPSQPIEVKGTEAVGLAWAQLKVSSAASMELLTEKAAPVYRVSAVFSGSPKVYVLTHGKDFRLEPEARWTFKPVRQASPMLAPASQSSGGRGAGSAQSKYDALRIWLQSQAGATVTLKFADAEKVLSFALPASAYKHQAFWANQRAVANRPWARAWTAAGFRVAQCKVSPNGWVRFRRV